MSGPQDVIRAFWAQRARLASPEAARFHTEHIPFDQMIIAPLVKPKDRILDLGCGTCVIANWLATEKAAFVHGVDGQVSFLASAVEHPALTTEVAAIETYAPAGRFDGVILMGVINYLIDEIVRDRLYARLVAALAPGGFILIKNQFGIEGPVEVNDHSPALEARYYSLYPGISAEKALLAQHLPVEVLDLYPPALSPHANTHFYHLLGRLQG